MCDISDVTRGHQGIVPVVAVGFFPLFKQQRIAICTSESQGSEHCQKPCLGAPDRGSASLAGERCVRQQQVMFQNHLQKNGSVKSGRCNSAKMKGRMCARRCLLRFSQPRRPCLGAMRAKGTGNRRLPPLSVLTGSAQHLYIPQPSSPRFVQRFASCQEARLSSCPGEK